MTKSKRLLAIILSLILTVAGLPIFAMAETTETEEYKQGDIIRFGSYPQTEVSDETLKAKLTEKAGTTDNWTSYNYYQSYEKSDFMKYKDIELDGEKYRGVYFTSYRLHSTGGSDECGGQDYNGYYTSTIYWFEYEPIVWQILSYDATTDTAVVLSKFTIDSQEYYDNYNNRIIDGKTIYANNYEYSNIRAWLNDSFYNTAFTNTEKNVIIATTLDNSAYSAYWSEYDSNSTTDNIWLLSYDEAQNADYGFTADYNENKKQQAPTTDYAKSQGIIVNTDNTDTYEYTWWRLRSAGNGLGRACCVDIDGYVNYNYDILDTCNGVRPALTLHLKSNTMYPGKKIEFGSYPQSQVTDETLKSKLTNKAGSPDNWTSYNYYISGKQGDFMKYKDIELDGEKYRGVYFTSYRPSYTWEDYYGEGSNQGHNGYYKSTIYWFKYEPIIWQILSYDETTETAVVLSKYAIDSQEYYDNFNERTIDGKTIYPNNYEHSNIRAWLNNSFYNTAFSADEKQAIAATTIDNKSDSSDNSQNNSNFTTDNVWLLSIDEAPLSGSEYGWYDDFYNTPLQAKTTDYAKSQGIYMEDANEYTWWRLRTAAFPTLTTTTIYYITPRGWIFGAAQQNSVDCTGIGICPALTINLKSDVSSGLGDVDGNGEINVSDARLALRAAVKLDTLTGASFASADVDFSGDISVSDARLILRVAVKLDDPKDWIK